MSSSSKHVVCAVVVLFVAWALVNQASVAAQAERYVISAKAGGVNLISGKVSVRRRGETEWQPFTIKKASVDPTKKAKIPISTYSPGEELAAGDEVRTESDGRLEVLLNPGSYLRLAENSDLELIDDSLDSLRLKLNKGVAVLEATGGGDVQMLTEIVTPQTTISIVKTGLYRINVSSAQTEVAVRKGRAVVGSASVLTIKDGKKAIITGADGVNLAKYDKKEQDAFDFWSKQRAEMLTAVNRNLPDAMISNAIFSSGYRPLRSRTGLWIYDPFLNSNTFFPFYSGWSSPYGLGYSGGFGYSSGYYRPNPIYPRSNNNPPPNANQPVTNAPPPTSGIIPPNRNVRGRKDLEGDVLPIRPIESNTQGQRAERTYGGGMSPSERSESRGDSRPADGGYRNNPAPARETPTYSAPSAVPSRQSDPSSERMGPRGKNLEP